MIELHSLQTSPATLVGILFTFALLLYALHGVYRQKSLRVATILRWAILFTLALAYTYIFLCLFLWLDSRLQPSSHISCLLFGSTVFGPILLFMIVSAPKMKRLKRRHDREK